jgi:MIP family channel proteins
LSQSIDVIRDTTGTQASFLIATSLAFGFGITVLVYVVAPVSGGHINPAVTSSLLLLGEISMLDAAAYIVTQMSAAVLGAALVWGSMNHDITRDVQEGDPPFLIGMNAVDSGISNGAAFLLELLGTFLLVITVCMTAVSKKSIAGNVAPIAIGWSVLLAHLLLIPFTGCGINPARVFGPMVMIMAYGESISYSGWWVYYVAPFVGGGLAAFTYKYVLNVPDDEEEEKVIKEVETNESAADCDAANEEAKE